MLCNGMYEMHTSANFETSKTYIFSNNFSQIKKFFVIYILQIKYTESFNKEL